MTTLTNTYSLGINFTITCYFSTLTNRVIYNDQIATHIATCIVTKHLNCHGNYYKYITCYFSTLTNHVIYNDQIATHIATCIVTKDLNCYGNYYKYSGKLLEGS